MKVVYIGGQPLWVKNDFSKKSHRLIEFTIYDVLDTYSNYPRPDDISYSIINLNGIRTWYNSSYFKTLEEYREEQLNKIL